MDGAALVVLYFCGKLLVLELKNHEGAAWSYKKSGEGYFSLNPVTTGYNTTI
jgi:hypothetical protein